MPILRDFTRFDEVLLPLWFRECTPKVLVVTDGLNYNAGSDFGLTRFVDALRASTIHGMTPIVRTATHTPGSATPASLNAATQHISNFQFADPAHGVLKSRYDVVFMLSIDGESDPGLGADAGGLAALTAFMQAGGGVFATGDHEDLGAAMCMTVPRVRAMRRWAAADTPSAGGTDRLTTNLPGSDDAYEFSDQADALPQRLFVNYRTVAGGVGAAHPVLQVPGSTRAIEVFPDHPHEGACVVPTDLSTLLADGITAEWPVETGGAAVVVPEAIALTVSHGNAFPGKAAVEPNAFIPICAYDGQRAGVGRVVTDATWHHVVNVNLVGLTGRNLDDVHRYYANLALWLMPKNVRRCLRYPLLVSELLRYPLFEEIPPIPPEKLPGPRLRELGALIEIALLKRHSAATVRTLMDDALEEVLPAAGRQALDSFDRRFGEISSREAGLAALAGLTLATGATARELQRRDVKEHADEVFHKAVAESIRTGVLRYLGDARDDLRRLDRVIESLVR